MKETDRAGATPWLDSLRLPPAISPVSLGLALFCFLLPFVNVSCGGAAISFTGVDLAFGTTVQGEKVSGDPFASLAFLGALGALALSVLRKRVPQLGSSVTAAVAALFLLLLRARIKSALQRQGLGAFSVVYEPAYWLSWIGLMGGALVGYIRANNLPREASEAGTTQGAVRNDGDRGLSKGS
jgi:hypothetical protein